MNCRNTASQVSLADTGDMPPINPSQDYMMRGLERPSQPADHAHWNGSHWDDGIRRNFRNGSRNPVPLVMWKLPCPSFRHWTGSWMRNRCPQSVRW